MGLPRGHKAGTAEMRIKTCAFLVQCSMWRQVFCFPVFSQATCSTAMVNVSPIYSTEEKGY